MYCIVDDKNKYFVGRVFEDDKEYGDPYYCFFGIKLETTDEQNDTAFVCGIDKPPSKEMIDAIIDQLLEMGCKYISMEKFNNGKCRRVTHRIDRRYR